jgi:hypothetical protein
MNCFVCEKKNTKPICSSCRLVIYSIDQSVIFSYIVKARECYDNSDSADEKNYYAEVEEYLTKAILTCITDEELQRRLRYDLFIRIRRNRGDSRV